MVQRQHCIALIRNTAHGQNQSNPQPQGSGIKYYFQDAFSFTLPITCELDYHSGALNA